MIAASHLNLTGELGAVSVSQAYSGPLGSHQPKISAVHDPADIWLLALSPL